MGAADTAGCPTEITVIGVGRLLAMLREIARPHGRSVTEDGAFCAYGSTRLGIRMRFKIGSIPVESGLGKVQKWAQAMLLDPQKISTREKLILAGLYLSKYDGTGLKKLGFASFVEAFNVIGYALGQKPASIKNYRDEFDPLFPNRRRGWHKRPTRDYCLKVFKDYKDLDIDTFTGLIKSFAGYDEGAWSELWPSDEKPDGESHFAKRLITGLAAERYFESAFPTLSEFRNCSAENTTRLGCGYDFRLHLPTGKDFLAVEVKGLKESSGSLSLTPKEHEVASLLKTRFFLFVVKNFRESPYHEIYPNPIAGALRFQKKERVLVHTFWLANV
jgi:hypothetical protein